jgi:hypothetical protein
VNSIAQGILRVVTDYAESFILQQQLRVLLQTVGTLRLPAGRVWLFHGRPWRLAAAATRPIRV